MSYKIDWGPEWEGRGRYNWEPAKNVEASAISQEVAGGAADESAVRESDMVTSFSHFPLL